MVDPTAEVKISADAHVAEPLDLWRERMPARYRDRAFHWPGQRLGKGQYRREGGWDPAARLRDMAADGCRMNFVAALEAAQRLIRAGQVHELHALADELCLRVLVCEHQVPQVFGAVYLVVVHLRQQRSRRRRHRRVQRRAERPPSIDPHDLRVA